jgi:hypothetical protein
VVLVLQVCVRWGGVGGVMLVKHRNGLQGALYGGVPDIVWVNGSQWETCWGGGACDAARAAHDVQPISLKLPQFSRGVLALLTR